MTLGLRLEREGDRLVLVTGDPPARIPVTPVWARPITGRGGDVAFLDGEKREVLMLPGLSALDPDSRALAEAELERRYLVARITRVLGAETVFGTQYWRVETDKGPRRLALKSDNRNAVWITPDHLVLRDTLGSRYEIHPFSGLDAASRLLVRRVL